MSETVRRTAELIARLPAGSRAVEGDDPGRLPGDGSLPGVAWWNPAPERLTADTLERLAAALVPGSGRLLTARPAPLRGGFAPAPWPEWVATLYENGWSVERDGSDGELETVRARRDGVQVRAYREGDERAICALFERSFYHPQSLEHWAWRYRDNPHGGLRILCAERDGELLGHYAGDVVRLVDARRGPPRTFVAHQIGDTMTAPRARGVGLGPTSVLGRMARCFFARFSVDGIALHYGFNTATARSMSLRYVPGARWIEPVTVWRSPPPPGSADGDVRVVRAERFGDEWREMARRVAPAYRVMVERDPVWLNWRYASRPGVPYQIWLAYRDQTPLGAGVFRRQGEELVWGDAWFDPAGAEPAAAALVAAARRANDDATVAAWFSRRPEWWLAVLSRLGFVAEVEPADLALLDSTIAGDAAGAMAALYVTKGASDLF